MTYAPSSVPQTFFWPENMGGRIEMKAGEEAVSRAGKRRTSHFSRRQLAPSASVAVHISRAALLLPVLVWPPGAGRQQFPAQALIAWAGGQNSSGRSVQVAAGADLQAALNAANPGDTLILKAGATYIGNFKLPNKPGDSYVTVTTSALASLPPEGQRISPAHSQYLPKLVAAPGDAVLIAANSAHHYRFVGIECTPAPSAQMTYDIVKMGLGTETEASTLPHGIIFDRVYIHGNPGQQVRRGISLNGISITVQNSYISDIKGLGQDTQAIEGWNGPGPFKILNNYLEAAGENIMFGGAKASIPNLVPSDIEVRQNYLSKPLSWRKEDPNYAGAPWTVKNLFELKNAQRVTVDGNVMEHSWTMAQTGFAVLFTPRAEEGRMPWAVVQDVTFTHNLIRHVSSGFTILGVDDTDKTTKGMVRLHRVLIRNNLLVDVSGTRWTGHGELFGLYGGPDEITIDHNTGFEDGFVALADGKPTTNLRFTNNIALRGRYGFVGTAAAEGSASLAKFAPGALFSKNAIVGGDPSLYPAGNYFPASPSAVGFVDYSEGQFQLALSSRYRKAGTDGKDLGADISGLEAITAGVVEGRRSVSD
jgi:hypothetical protein